jgi:hypothetical protein
MRGPFPLSTNTGVPPTPLKARTGELTPPGILFLARLNSSSCLAIAAILSSGAADI